MKLSKIAFLTLCLISTITFSQTEKGKFFIGASSDLNYSSLKLETSVNNSEFKTKQFNIAPTAGYFVIENLAVGLSAAFSNSKEGDTDTNTFIFSPIVKKYFLKDNFRPFALASYGFGSSKTETIFFDPFFGPIPVEQDNDVQSLTLGVGAAYFINNFISLELSLNYLRQTFEATSAVNNATVEQTVSGFISNVAFTIFL